MDRAIAHNQRQPIPVLDAATTTLIELITTNARMTYPIHMPLFREIYPDGERAVRAVAAGDATMKLEERQLGLYLYNKSDLLVAVVYVPKQANGRWP